VTSTSRNDDRPNLLLFMTDQQRADSVGAFGNPLASTPHLDALAARGVRFTSAYSQHSACSQSRISMMTGWYPHVAGHRTLDHLLQPWEPNVLATLRNAGYFVAWPGIRGDTFAEGVTQTSTDFFGYTTPPSLEALAASHEDRFPEGHRLRNAFYIGRLEGPAQLTPDEAAIRTAIELLEGPLPEPFALVVTLFSPHPPFAVEEPWYSLHDRASMPAPRCPGSGKPAFMRTLRDRAGLDQLEPADWAEITATYYGMVSRLDDQLGRLQEALGRTGVADRTVTFFFTDHGEYLGDFGLVEKWPSGLDDCLLRNPLIVAGPGIAQGAECTSFVEMIDVPVTLCDLAQTSFEHPHFGRSLRPVLADPTQPHRRAAYSEGGFRLDEEPQNEQPEGHPYQLKGALQHEQPELVGRALSVRTRDWTFIYRSQEQDELYDRQQDPYELRNLAPDPAYASVCRQLRDQLFAWLVETSDVIPRRRDVRIEPALFEQLIGSQVALPPAKAHAGPDQDFRTDIRGGKTATPPSLSG
jgi:arylsulfatase A-like enzyme